MQQNPISTYNILLVDVYTKKKKKSDTFLSFTFRKDHDADQLS